MLGVWAGSGGNDSTQSLEVAEYSDNEELTKAAPGGEAQVFIPMPYDKPAINTPPAHAVVASLLTSSEALESPGVGDTAEAGVFSVNVEMGKGDTFISLMSEAGVSYGDAHEVSQVLKKVLDLRGLRPGQKMEVQFEQRAGEEENFFQALKVDQPDNYILVKRDEEKGFVANEIEKQLAKKAYRAGGKIDSSLFQLASDAGIPTSIVMEAIRAYSYDVDFQRDIQPGASFEVMYDIVYDDQGNKVREGDLLFARLVMDKDELKIYRYTPSKDEPGYYHADGTSIRKALLRTPVNGARMSSGFGMRRHPVLGYSKMHKGIDFAAPTGTPIYAAGDGVIEKIGRYGSYGKYVRLRHNDKYSTAYAHMSRFANGMKQGRRVKQGQVIGYVGTTGRSTGPHLHYETLVYGKHINPMNIKMTSGKKLAGAELKAFESTKTDIEARLASLPMETLLASRE